MADKRRLIDANELKEYHTVLWDEALGFCACVLVDDIDNAPTVDAVEVKRGRWLKHHSNRYECSCCKVHFITCMAKDWDYCPNCGAKMDGDGNG